MAYMCVAAAHKTLYMNARLVKAAANQAWHIEELDLPPKVIALVMLKKSASGLAAGHSKCREVMQRHIFFWSISRSNDR